MILVFIFFQPNSTTSENRIVGGIGIAPGEIPFICSIRQRMPSANSWSWWTYTHQCGGTVVNGNWLLTSAHCIFGKDIASLLVVCGYRQGQTIERVALKPDYVHGRRGNDLALVLLKSALVFSETVQPIPIFDQRILSSNVATIVGYGLSSYGTECCQSNGLQAAIVPILSYNQCYQRLGSLAAYLTGDTICTDTSATATGTCIGDSGGPVMIATARQPFNLLAMPSWTVNPCGSGPSVHTLISPHLGWILDVITPKLENNKCIR
ncbi:trypsin-4-like [Ochlerotatus camptorhynchus]|uniref:trypsin-4-like n=1 Tax=Ochlerotatus camptorhynchus TaxID=644619 RepID=UPI0031DD3B40